MKSHRFDINGILLLDKPPIEMSSNQVLQKVKRLYAAKKAGHTGSLDPLATGMLPLCFGESTKFSQYLLDADKTYQVKATLGLRTNTYDAEGETIARETVLAEHFNKLSSVLETFRGEIEQVPPMFSAIKIQGQPLYKLARRGIEVEREARKVTIFSLTELGRQENEIELEVRCSKGTYIRTLVDDIGQSLGCGAFVSALRRTSVSPFEGMPMHSLDSLESLVAEKGHSALLSLLLPMEAALHVLPEIILNAASVFYLKTGQAVMSSRRDLTGLVRLYDQGKVFLGLGEVLEDGRVAPKRLLSQV
jgi:tRNA pseudouridine55 synthase